MGDDTAAQGAYEGPPHCHGGEHEPLAVGRCKDLPGYHPSALLSPSVRPLPTTNLLAAW